MFRAQLVFTTIAFCLLATSHSAVAQVEFEHAPIHYESQTPTDRVFQLGEALSKGSEKLTWDERHGWLPSLLEKLQVPVSSQTLVFSKTSLQIRRISASRPRALYFNDDIYVGWVQGGDFVELSAVDSQQGAMFYKMEQIPDAAPTVIRDRGECMACHASSRTQQVPGFLVRSVYPNADGLPEYRLGTTTTDHRTAFADRFGGWYVTGTHGAMRHRGNVTIDKEYEEKKTPPLDMQRGANLLQPPKFVRSEKYLTNRSDIVALMLLEHQTQMHNWITRANYTTRQALYQQATMNRILERAPDYQSESTTRRIESAAEKMLRYMLFCDEYPLTDSIKGNSKFAEQFVAMGPRDAQNRSLRDFDMQRRMFKYPCSFLIYSKSFLSLPQPVLDYVKRRLQSVLSNEDTSDEFAHLSSHDRQQILSILQETHPLFRSSSSED